jgi:hypothetical protein
MDVILRAKFSLDGCVLPEKEFQFACLLDKVPHLQLKEFLSAAMVISRKMSNVMTITAIMEMDAQVNAKFRRILSVWGQKGWHLFVGGFVGIERLMGRKNVMMGMV